ncbi:MAG: DUF4190 domain-containing protein [Firmicutes bacterium]|nr:DUF4190 domain-containing protein [Bacillota bacterium]
MYGSAPVPGKNKAIASLVLGIIAIVFFWIPIFNTIPLILAIIGLILAIGARKDMDAAGAMDGRGLATAGLVCSIVGLALSAVGFITCTVCVVYTAATGGWSWSPLG